jgi:hypothetical protein
MSVESRNFSGLLLEWAGNAIQRGDLLRAAGLRFDGLVGSSAWEKYVFDSPVPLRGEDLSVYDPPFRYPLICRRSGSRLLVLSVSRSIAERLLGVEFHAAFVPRLKPVPIGVDQLVKGITARPTEYALSFAHARVPAFGATLRAISYYGEDLAEAALFRDQLPLMVFFTCGLREARGVNEIVRLGGDGHVSFLLSTPRRVIEVERALSFLRREGYLASDLWPPE